VERMGHPFTLRRQQSALYVKKEGRHSGLFLKLEAPGKIVLVLKQIKGEGFKAKSLRALSADAIEDQNFIGHAEQSHQESGERETYPSPFRERSQSERSVFRGRQESSAMEAHWGGPLEKEDATAPGGRTLFVNGSNGVKRKRSAV